MQGQGRSHGLDRELGKVQGGLAEAEAVEDIEQEAGKVVADEEEPRSDAEAIQRHLRNGERAGNLHLLQIGHQIRLRSSLIRQPHQPHLQVYDQGQQQYPFLPHHMWP